MRRLYVAINKLFLLNVFALSYSFGGQEQEFVVDQFAQITRQYNEPLPQVWIIGRTVQVLESSDIEIESYLTANADRIDTASLSQKEKLRRSVRSVLQQPIETMFSFARDGQSYRFASATPSLVINDDLVVSNEIDSVAICKDSRGSWSTNNEQEETHHSEKPLPLEQQPYWILFGSDVNTILNGNIITRNIARSKVISVQTSGSEIIADAVLAGTSTRPVRYVFDNRSTGPIKLRKMFTINSSNPNSLSKVIWEFSAWHEFAPQIYRPKSFRIAKYTGPSRMLKLDESVHGLTLLESWHYIIDKLQVGDIPPDELNCSPSDKNTIISTDKAGNTTIEGLNRDAHRCPY